jgi:farnesyl-diphosphate farnesyltransferase
METTETTRAAREAPPDLDAILKGVSRSFYLTLRVAPRRVRPQLGVAYLFCRAADTIADTALLPPERRLALLGLYRAQFEAEAPDRRAAASIAAELTGARSIPEERLLLEGLDRPFDAYLAFPQGDRALVRRLVTTLTLGMEMDLRSFPLAGEREAAGGPAGAEAIEPEALAADADLDRYCYHVAGCVGEFWTDIAISNLPALRRWDPAGMREKGVRFGKGLQMTNVLRDIPQDLRKGRCSLPRARLGAAGLSPGDLRGGGTAGRPLPAALDPVLDDLLDLTLDHYRAGWEYTLAIPASAPRLRLACAWPLLIGLGTLDLLRNRKADLRSGAVLRVAQNDVWRILGGSALRVFSAGALDGMYRRREAPARRRQTPLTTAGRS